MIFTSSILIVDLLRLFYILYARIPDSHMALTSKALAVKVYSIPVDTLHPEQFFGPKTVREVPIT